MKIHKLISSRKSIRAFEEKRSITEGDMLRLFEAARWAPSSRNEQPWRFISARKEDSESFTKMAACLFESNKSWARYASALVLVLAKNSFTDSDAPNTYALYDTGMAVANLGFQATSQNIALHQLGGFDHAKAIELFHVPAGYAPVVIIALGYQGPAETLSEPYRSREVLPRKRKELSELHFTKSFGEIK